MKRILRVILIVIMVLMFQTGCVVWDAIKEIALEVDQFVKKQDWDRYLEKVGDLLDIKEEIKEAFEINKAPVKPGVRKLFRDNIILKELADSTQTRDPEKNDPWWEIWQGEKTIYEKFPEFKEDFKDIKNSELYKEKFWKEYFDKFISLQKENIKDFEGIVEFIVESHRIDNGENIEEDIFEGGGIEKLKNFQDQLLKFSKNGQEGKMNALLGFIENEIMKVEMITETMKRIFQEYQLKVGVREAVLGEFYTQMVKKNEK